MKLGCIADDFTGATDLANNLVRSGMRVVQTIGVPDVPLAAEVDAVVATMGAPEDFAGGDTEGERISGDWQPLGAEESGKKRLFRAADDRVQAQQGQAHGTEVHLLLNRPFDIPDGLIAEFDLVEQLGALVADGKVNISTTAACFVVCLWRVWAVWWRQ